MLATVIGSLPVALLSHGPASRSWARAPREAPYPRPRVEARWDRGSSASLALLRHVTAREAHHAQLTLADCERHAHSRVPRYRRCAMTALDRAQAYASANSRMLSLLVEGAVPTKACRRRVMALSGSTGLLAQIARSTRLSGLDAPWTEVRAASRSIRDLARDALRQAHGSEWATTCAPRPRAPAAPEGPVA
ncbi:hypothetical protein [Candidatus Solirubrobacter pratensis]|uniref:hypothetical protein n=1 Tax=Candidatus Solirubrobacter pratensis TaxID=1298857 RepID=UPI0004229334|nr:hypothetical protein [Candidatus Solirubrobacter pratensis]